MNSLLKEFRLGATALAAAFLLVSASPSFVAFAQTTSPPATTSAGSSELTIKALQEALNKEGFAVKIDGILNDATRAAIRQYQTQHHVPVTGEPDKATLDKLGVTVRQGAAPEEQTTQEKTATTTGAGSPMMGPQMMQGGMMPGGTMNCPMMPGQAQSASSCMTQGSVQPGQIRGQTPQGGAVTGGSMMQGQMQAMMQMMQGMTKMMQMMQEQMQQGSTRRGPMQPRQM